MQAGVFLFLGFRGEWRRRDWYRLFEGGGWECANELGRRARGIVTAGDDQPHTRLGDDFGGSHGIEDAGGGGDGVGSEGWETAVCGGEKIGDGGVIG